MNFLSTATPNRCNPNGFMPNQVGDILCLADTVTPSDSAARGLDMAPVFSDVIVATDAIVKTFGINPSETVKMTDWTLQKKTGQDFTGE